VLRTTRRGTLAVLWSASGVVVTRSTNIVVDRQAPTVITGIRSTTAVEHVRYGWRLRRNSNAKGPIVVLARLTLDGCADLGLTSLRVTFALSVGAPGIVKTGIAQVRLALVLRIAESRGFPRHIRGKLARRS